MAGLLSDLDQETADETIQAFHVNQPFLLAYLIGVGETLDDTDDIDSLILLCIMSWMLYKSKNPELPSVSDISVLENEERILAEIDSMDELGHEIEPDTPQKIKQVTDKWKKDYHQPHLFNYIADEVTSLFDAEDRGTILATLIIIMDALQEVSDKTTPTSPTN
jgi:hypothetical protein